MASFVEILVLLATLGFIALPLMGRFGRPAAEGVTEGELSELLYKKDAVYTALKDLDFDHRTGKIDRADYEEMKRQFETDAMSVIATIETLQAGGGAATAPERDAARRFCAACGNGAKPGDKFCASCGTKLA
ncbi:MAG: hypothetical protein HQK87_08980 [Nitrospinae bacterium]|nr:hypothetical protein [Nitrospinota bacterium]